MVKKIIVAMLSILLIAAIIGLCVYLFKGPLKGAFDDLKNALDTDFKVEYEDTVFKGIENQAELPDTGKAIFKVSNGENIRVSVLPAVDFEFTVNGETKHFQYEVFTNVFLTKENVYADHIVIDCEPNKFNVENVLKSLYGDDTKISIPKELETRYIYKIVFTSESKQSISIDLSPLAGSIQLSSNHEVFAGV